EPGKPRPAEVVQTSKVGEGFYVLKLKRSGAEQRLAILKQRLAFAKRGEVADDAKRKELAVLIHKEEEEVKGKRDAERKAANERTASADLAKDKEIRSASLAITRLEKLVATYPETKAAAEARALLEELRKK